MKPVKSGDIVDVVAPASACTRAELVQGVHAIRRLGLVPRVPKNLFGRSHLFANSDALRLKHLQRAIYAADSKLVWCVRGGYGAIRLMPEVVRWRRPTHSKIFLGYSDITTLHLDFNQRWGWPTLHGPLLDRFGRDGLTPRERKELLGLISGTLREVEFNGLKALNRQARQTRVVRGRVLGGNMTVMASGLGTASALKPGPHILFFEDTGERPHRVDRMLTQMTQAGWFKNCRAIVLGGFILKDPRDLRILRQDVFPRFAATLKIPFLAGLAVGHKDRGQRTLPLNTPARLYLGQSPRLVVDSGILRS